MPGTSTVPGSVLSLSAAGQDNLVWAGTDRGALVSFRVDSVGRLTKCHRTVVSDTGVTSVTSRPGPSGVSLLLVNAGNNSLLLYTVTEHLGSLSLHRKFPLVHKNLR